MWGMGIWLDGMMGLWRVPEGENGRMCVCVYCGEVERGPCGVVSGWDGTDERVLFVT